MQLPVGNVETAIPFFERVIGLGLNPAAMSRTSPQFLNKTGQGAGFVQRTTFWPLERLIETRTANALFVLSHMSILTSRNIAVFLGIITPLLETIRRWSTWTEDPLSFFDDYLLGGLLLYGAWRVTKDVVEGQRYLVLGWAFAFGMAFGGLIAQLRLVRVGEADPAPVSAEWVLVVKLLGMAIILLGLALSLRKLKTVDG